MSFAVFEGANTSWSKACASLDYPRVHRCGSLGGFFEERYNEHAHHLVKQMTQLEMKVAEGGKVEIPSEVAMALGWQVGEKLTVQVQNGEVRIFSQAQAVRRVQTWVKSFVSEGRSLSDELIAERRQEEALHE
ncbi:hypothetical protein LEP3755_27950 [Leptolyngbya sp. NIES-3755]|nr:hypothetical protein LEP3755_27950 [Leptolyngbya sp. NIES-3755]